MAEDSTLIATASSQGQSTVTDPRLAKFKIAQIVKEKYADLIPLIISTESMNDQERSYWFQILPIMSAEQVERLRKILVTEKDELKKLDSEYQKEIDKIDAKKAEAIKKFEVNEQKREEIKKEESKEEAQESKHEEDILAQLNNI